MNWNKLLEEAVPPRCKDRPKGAKTVAELASEWGYSRQHTHTILTRLVSEGKVTRVRGTNGQFWYSINQEK